MNARSVTAFTAGVTTTTAVAALILRMRTERLRSGFERDELTGLLNRKGWERQLARRSPARGQNVVLIADCNGLKRVNDTFGHAAGDRLITAAGHALAAALGDGAIVARLGGDEFVALCGPTALDRLRACGPLTVETPSTTAAGARSRLAIGASAVTGGMAEAMHRADAAMYRNKRDQDAAFALFDPVSDDTGLADRRPEVRVRDLDSIDPVREMETVHG